ncbi:M4 family metallopeptidase [Streptomyces zagrosensis]|uniref:Zn-dependent metalloprotease n=1 Tax=Streptomyces zagrosensis TaxID=1042984 RepID=A0A7W9QDQ0_9ACTN|nr:M4 family metallopeptidase [Streptomyces zagrosensis]MBB5937332.1 Zn-dependent metalloprotease [Streptomyces zagrosensis]
MRHPRRGSGRRGGRRSPLSGISGAAALASAAALVVSALPAVAATATSAPPPSPGEVIPGQETQTPTLVQGIREQAPATGNAAGAARTYLDGKQGRYRIADAKRDLVPAGTTAVDGQETVRLQQRHGGVPVLGGQYVVRMEKKDGERVVTGTSGKYFTELRTGTTPEVGEALAVERAVDSVRTQLNERHFTAQLEPEGEQDAPPLVGTARGLVVLPTGAGVLTRHVTVRGTDPASGEPVLREVYVDARAGYPVLQYSGIKTFDAPRTAVGEPAADAPRAAVGEPAADTVKKGARVPEKGTGAKLDGKAVTLDVEHDVYRDLYVLRDLTRIPETDWANNSLSTWDARGKTPGEVSGQWPADVAEFGSPTPAFGTEATDVGAVDAHWAAGQVYDYFKGKHGRNSFDDHGMTVRSLVGVANYGDTYVNAFWDGQKIVYGVGDAEYRPLSAGMDVVGHEMTHGVVEHTANLVYAGQSGAMNEAIADYFGNAIEADVYGIPVSDPDSGLIGERLCRTKAPRECALRDLGDGRTTTKSFLGLGFANDNGGVHLNSTIFGGALWDAREDLGADLTDKIVYKALTEYLTPLDGFTEGRAAVLAAAKDLKIPAADHKALQRAFTAHGIVPGWELALGVDSENLLDRINTTDTNLGGGGGWWAASKSNEDGSEPYSVWAGRGDGKGQPKLMSPNDGRYHVKPATDGKTVVWQAYGVGGGTNVLSRPLAGGPVKKLWSGRGVNGTLDVDGDVVTFGFANHGGRAGVLYLSLKDPANLVRIGGGTYHRAYSPSVSHGKVVYQEKERVRAVYEWSTRVVDVATGENKEIQRYPNSARIGPTAINGTHVFWLLDEGLAENTTTLRRAAIDGSGVVDLSPQVGPNALNAYNLAASESTVTVGSYVPDTEIRNESTPKLYQFGAGGSPEDPGNRKGRVSCNRGEQASPAAVAGSQAVWLDSTTGTTNVAARTRPAGRCG